MPNKTMANKNDVHTYYVEKEITVSEGNDDVEIGTTIITYEVKQYVDVRNLVETRSYKVTCRQRVIIPNQTPYSLNQLTTNSFENYPGILSNQFLLAPPASANLMLIDYSPKTLNTAVSTSSDQSDGSSSSTTQQHTLGSSTAQTNSYGGSASLGAFGDVPTGSISGNYEHSSTNTQSTSNTTGTDTGTSDSSSSDDSFSIKDWGSYAYLDTENTTPTWVWGQEYPWDIVKFRYCPTGNTVELPEYVQSRLFDGTQIYPPSHLSLFGIDFKMKSQWLVTPDASATADQTIKITHTLTYLTASHEADSNNDLVASLPPSPIKYTYTSDTLDLCLLALDPILSASSTNGAVVGFIDNKFMVPPSSATATYKIVSGDNNLLVSGTGFDNAMTTTFASGSTATIIVQFKILDSDNNYTLYLKHWKTSDEGCTLKFTFNGDTSNVIEKTIESREAEGGDNNMTSINMRNKDYSSVNYHDYLQLGLNEVEIEITPNATSGCSYEIRALAIGSS